MPGHLPGDAVLRVIRRGQRGRPQANAQQEQALGHHPAATGVQDSDAYSHFSFVRTLQDMFGLANPDQPGSYMNRSKYTQAFIAANSSYLTEFASSADPYFDAVRPMNGQYMVPNGYTLPPGYLEKVSSDTTVSGTPLTGASAPETPKVNVWALAAGLQ